MQHFITHNKVSYRAYSDFQDYARSMPLGLYSFGCPNHSLYA